MRISKAKRIQVYDKYAGRCAYCGKEIPYEKMEVDHIISKLNFFKPHIYPGYSDVDAIENLNPACKRCNLAKDTFSVEQFRIEIYEKTFRLRRDSSNYRIAFDFGMIEETENQVLFYFETI